MWPIGREGGRGKCRRNPSRVKVDSGREGVGVGAGN